MKIVELTTALDGVPELLRTAATEIREGRTTRKRFEKTAALTKVKVALSDSPPEEEEDILSGISEINLEKLADRLAPRSSLGEVSEEASSAERTTRDADFLDNLRTFQ